MLRERGPCVGHVVLDPVEGVLEGLTRYTGQLLEHRHSPHWAHQRGGEFERGFRLAHGCAGQVEELQVGQGIGIHQVKYLPDRLVVLEQVIEGVRDEVDGTEVELDVSGVRDSAMHVARDHVQCVVGSVDLLDRTGPGMTHYGGGPEDDRGNRIPSRPHQLFR